MQDTLRDRYNLENRRRHGGIQEYPFVVNLFPDLYQNAAGAYAIPPFQLTLAANGQAMVPFILPRDALYRMMYFRYELTAPATALGGAVVYVSARLSSVGISLVQNSGGGRTGFATELLNPFCGTNSGFGQVYFPYIHPKEGSLSFAFQNLFPAERRITGWLYGMKVAS